MQEPTFTILSPCLSCKLNESNFFLEEIFNQFYFLDWTRNSTYTPSISTFVIDNIFNRVCVPFGPHILPFIKLQSSNDNTMRPHLLSGTVARFGRKVSCAMHFLCSLATLRRQWMTSRKNVGLPEMRAGHVLLKSAVFFLVRLRHSIHRTLYLFILLNRHPRVVIWIKRFQDDPQVHWFTVHNKAHERHWCTNRIVF